MKKSHRWIILAGLAGLILISGMYYVQGNATKETVPPPTPTVSDNVTPIENQMPTETVSSVPDEEKQQIEAWIEKNNLNFYGDPKDTVYAGGTPLFDEMTGTYKDRFEYILKNHPDRPWNK